MRKRNAQAFYDAYEITIKAWCGIKHRIRLRVEYDCRIKELYPNRTTQTKGIRNLKKDVMSIDLVSVKSAGKCHSPYRCMRAVAWKSPTLNDLIPHDLWGF